jgi:inhibitor of cysteine peptidase
MKTLFATLIGLFFLTTSCQAKPDMTLTVDKTQPMFQVKLEGNPTTGFQWNVLSFDKKTFQLQSKKFYAPKTKLMGAPGVMVFEFSLNKNQTYPNTTQMSFEYARPWEKGSAAKKTIEIIFK